MTKKFFTLFIAILSLTAYYSCTSSSKKQQATEISPEMEFRNSLTHEDSVKLVQLSDNCMELLKQNDIDGAVAMLHEYDDSTKTVTSLSPVVEKRMRHIFTVFPVKKYELEYYSVFREGLNDVRYKIWFAEEEDPAKNGEPVTHFMFNPVMVDGEWYLCVKGQGQEFDRMRL